MPEVEISEITKQGALDGDVADQLNDNFAALKAQADVIAALPTSNVASPAIWNDGGVLKVGTA